MTRVAVVGAGVVGLTAARALEEAGFDVRVVAERDGLEESSGAAGAMWFLYGAEYGDAAAQRADGQARATFAWLAELARTAPAAGVLVLPAWHAADDDAEPSWAASMPREAELAFHPLARAPRELHCAARGRRPAGAWRFRCPTVDPARHLAWLAGGLARPVERRRVRALAELLAEADLVVNCTGRRAEELVRDPALAPRRGRTLVAARGSLPRDRVLVDDRDEADMLYAIPRAGGEVVLGGLDVPRAHAGEELGPDAREAEALRARHAAAGIVPEDARERYGWRPGRRGGPRIERDQDEPRVLHAYGHGGAGFTLARGTALALVELARA